MAWERGGGGEVSLTLIKKGDEKKRKKENKGKNQKERKKKRKRKEGKSKRGKIGHFDKKRWEGREKM